MGRTFAIARREYLAYAKTVGFWLSLLSLPFFAVVGGGLVHLMRSSEPVRAVVVVAESPEAASLRAAVEAEIRGDTGEDGRRLTRLVETPPEIANAAPLDQVFAARRFLTDEAPEGRELDAVVFVARDEEEGGTPLARVWTRRTTDDVVTNAVRRALTDTNRRDVFQQAGVDPAVVARVDAYRPQVNAFSPRAADSGGEIGQRDRLPQIIGLAAGFLLWSLVLTGASILLNSVMEEKANKILEVLLSSASATEILAGKVLGVALVTLTMLVGWAIMAGGALGAFAPPDITSGVGEALLEGGLLFYFLAYTVGGYLMYAVLFAAIGAFCETPRDAQTLMGPIMMIMMVPLFVMQFALQSPDAPIIRVMSWIPFFTPFLMSVRAPADPPLLEIAATMIGMFAFAALMVWLAGRAFRAGALSDVKLNWRSFAAAIRGGGN